MLEFLLIAVGALLIVYDVRKMTAKKIDAGYALVWIGVGLCIMGLGMLPSVTGGFLAGHGISDGLLASVGALVILCAVVINLTCDIVTNNKKLSELSMQLSLSDKEVEELRRVVAATAEDAAAAAIAAAAESLTYAPAAQLHRRGRIAPRSRVR